MYRIFIGASKYFFILLMLLYTLNSFATINPKKPRTEKRRNGYQLFIMFLFHFLCSLIIYIETEKASVIVFYMLQVVYFFFVISMYRVIYPRCSKLLLNNMCMFLCIGFIMIERLSYDKAVKQFLIVFATTVFTFFIPGILKNVKVFAKMKYVYCLIGIALLGVVLVFGNTSFGANLSFNVGPVAIQPSEFVKIIYVFFIASMLAEAVNFKQVFITSILAAIHVLVLVASTDLGGALIYFIVYVMMLYTASGKFRYMLAGLGGGSAAAVLAYNVFGHIRVRVSAWLDPWSCITGGGWQVAQSLFAIGTGGWFGMGLYHGLPTRVPVVTKDFIFSAISEEFGIIFAICIILLCFSTFMIMMNLGTKITSPFYRLLTTGFGIMYIIQCFLTIGGAMKFIPSTGVTLPLVSYGGSSVMSTLIIFSVIQTVNILWKTEEKRIERQNEKRLAWEKRQEASLTKAGKKASEFSEYKEFEDF